MRSIIHQSVLLPAPASLLFDMYVDASRHAAFTGHPVTIGEESGSEFRAFDGMLSGTILKIVRPRLIVQSWRSLNFNSEDPDSPRVQRVTVAGAGGFPLWEDPKLANDHIRRHLRDACMKS